MFGLWISEMERIWRRKLIIIYCIFLLLVIANIWSLKIRGWGEFRFGEGKIPMNDLNMPWFMMSDVSLLLVAVILPIIFVDQLSGEIYSGAYRLYLLRPFRRFQFWGAKLLALAATTTIFISATYFVAILGAWLFFPHSDTLVMYGSTAPVGPGEAVLYTLKFYLLFVLTCIAKLMLSSVVCLFVSRPLIAFFVLFISSIVLYQFAKELVILFDPFQQILLAISAEGALKFWIYLFGSMIAFTIISFLRWERKVV
ncbi:hypothetical protein SAMN04487970_102248 [Paenibacillus tianmuensis]|uniref:ABC-2 family transporter protein n=1 Tax=Paenibacillus tianmuensis TaxID=624147 RepID=A0A1G4S429_9BACL|nr:ABC transporter permease [Paenibacillus tianmuensis]SCW63405.1 hypothetical protein SAMN04487970_102248 [Paenibacillus tianmuensis]